MGDRYVAHCAYYPFVCYDKEISGQHFIPFIFKVMRAIHKYDIVDINYRR